MKITLLLSRIAHDFLLANQPKELKRAFAESERVRWSLAGPAFVHLPADLAHALKAALPSQLRNQSQLCIS